MSTISSPTLYAAQQKNVIFNRTLQFRQLCTHFRPSEKKLSITHGSKKKCSSLICYSGSAEQTATVTKQSPTSTITNAPNKYADFDVGDGFPPSDCVTDHGGGGFPPGGDGGDGGGGGGWGGGDNGWSFGALILIGLLAFLVFMKDQETEESPYESRRRR